jgi:hypothetical protein
MLHCKNAADNIFLKFETQVPDVRACACVCACVCVCVCV